MKTINLMCGAALAALAVPAFAQSDTSGNSLDESSTSAAPAAASGANALEDDIVVTARRRDESLQDVPISVSAFSAASLERSTIQNLSDINTITPGLRFGTEGGKAGTQISLRGLSKVPLGQGTAGVVQYFADVALPASGGNFPTYDLSSIQVLKGPQGTLFGRNTLGGAILIAPQAPTDEFEGYIEGTYGSLDYRELEGALNLPLGDFAAVRVAGQIRRQDPRTTALETGKPGFDDIHQDSFRVSLRLEPTDWLKNTTIFDYFDADERALGAYLYRANARAVPALAVLDPQIAALLPIREANFYGAFDGGVNGGTSDIRYRALINDTSAKFGNFTIRNIFGYITSKVNTFANASGAPILQLPVGPGTSIPFVVFQGASTEERQYLTNELQLLGDFDNFNFIVGIFYNNDRPKGPSGSAFKTFSPLAAPTPQITSHFDNKNYAIFGQAGVKLTEQLTLNIGGRYSWDETTACGGRFPQNVYVGFGACVAQSETGNLTDGIGVSRYKGEEPSWTLGLDYQVNDDLLFYAATRRGYRAGAPNTPLFESPFTTGGIAPGCQFTTPPATGQCPDFRAFQISGEEKVTDVELGMKSNFMLGSARTRLNLAAFYMKYEGVLQGLNVLGTGIPQTAPDIPTRTSIGQNVADETIWGVEFEASVSPSPSLTVSVNGSYTKTKIDKFTLPAVTGFTFNRSNVNLPTPSFAGTVSASWILPVHPADGDLIFNADLYMTDDFGGAAGEQLPGYVLGNARLDWKGISGTGLDLGFYVRNLFKERYFTSPAILLKTFPTNSVSVGEPRTWGVSARYRF